MLLLFREQTSSQSFPDLGIPKMSQKLRPMVLHHRIPRNRFAEIGRAEFWCPLLRLEVDIDQAEPVRKTIAPFKIVRQAPVKVALDGHALRSYPLQMRRR